MDAQPTVTTCSDNVIFAINTKNNPRQNLPGSPGRNLGGIDKVQKRKGLLFPWFSGLRDSLANRPKTILLVENDDTLRELVKTVVAEQGYKVIAAKNGEEAVRAFSRAHSEIALVVSNIALPKFSGDRLLKRMQSFEPEVHVIFASSYLDPQLMTDLLNAGAKDFLLKPYAFTDLLAKIKEQFSQ